MSLRELQENFQAYILNDKKNILESIETEQSNALERIDIYKQGYVLRLLEILEKDFPIFKKRVGDERFEKLGRKYIENYPSDNFSICIFSRHFSKFLLDTEDEFYLSEMAAFEWALSCALDAADDVHIDLSELASIPPEAWPYVKFELHPSLTCHQFKTNAPQLTYAIMMDKEPPDFIDHQKPRPWIIWRFNFQSYFESLTVEQVGMIDAIQKGKNFYQICECLCEWLPEEEVASFAAGSLQSWISKGAFSSLKIDITADAEE